MISINTQSTSASYALNNLGSANGLTAESLMFWLSMNLDAIDTDIDAMLDQQTSALKQKEALQHYKHAMTDMKEKNERGDSAGAAQAWKEYETYVSELPADSPERAIAQQKLDHFDAEFVGKDFHAGQYETEIQEIASDIEELDKNSEMMMIRINQLMSQRQTAVQLAQAIMNKQNDTIESIVQKIS